MFYIYFAKIRQNDYYTKQNGWRGHELLPLEKIWISEHTLNACIEKII
jgi:hypothetical protein